MLSGIRCNNLYRYTIQLIVYFDSTNFTNFDNSHNISPRPSNLNFFNFEIHKKYTRLLRFNDNQNRTLRNVR